MLQEILHTDTRCAQDGVTKRAHELIFACTNQASKTNTSVSDKYINIRENKRKDGMSVISLSYSTCLAHKVSDLGTFDF